MEVSLPYRWEPRWYQRNLWSALEGGCKRAVAVWHRRAGKDLLSLNWTAREAMRRPGLYWHVLPTYNQGRKIVWNGKTGDGRPFLDYFPSELVVRKLDQDMTLWLHGGSIWQVVGTDDVDTLVGSNPVGIVFSEYSLQNPAAWNYLSPILAENGGWAMFIYTPRGRNHGWKLLQRARENPNWFAEVLPNEETGVVSEEAIEDLRDGGMPDEIILQEFSCSFDAPLVGAYYSHEMMRAKENGRITKVPWEPLKPVITAWDLGVRDATSIWFAQKVGHEVRLIDYYHATGVGLDHYAKVLREKPYAYTEHLVPHDARVKELGPGKTRVEQAAEMGLRMTVMPNIPLADGIQAARALLARCWFDEDHCEKGIEGLRSYTKKATEERDPDGNVVFQDTPLHNWASHPADAFRTLAMGIDREEWTEFEQPDASWVV